jgi:hypothetical protein
MRATGVVLRYGSEEPAITISVLKVFLSFQITTANTQNRRNGAIRVISYIKTKKAVLRPRGVFQR